MQHTYCNPAAKSRMVRYRYGPWDPAYYAVLGRLLGKRLVEPVPFRRGIGYRATNKGQRIAKILRNGSDWEEMAQRVRLLRRYFDLNGARLTRFIYEHFPEVASSSLGGALVRIEFRSLSLVGTNRIVRFKPGLNLIHGPISTGKTSILRLCRIALGALPDALPEELRLLPNIGAHLILGDAEYQVLRPLTTTRNARVEVVTQSEAYRLPAYRADRVAETTYTRFLLERLGLPGIIADSTHGRPRDTQGGPPTWSPSAQYCGRRPSPRMRRSRSGYPGEIHDPDER